MSIPDLGWQLVALVALVLAYRAGARWALTEGHVAKLMEQINLAESRTDKVLAGQVELTNRLVAIENRLGPRK